MPEWPIPMLGNGLRKGSPLASWNNRDWAMGAFLPYRKSGRLFPGRKMRGAADTVPMDTGRRDHSGRIGTTPGTHGNVRERRERRRCDRTQPGSLSDFGAGFGPKGLGNLAQALAWVALE